jgi:hypothetical protein
LATLTHPAHKGNPDFQKESEFKYDCLVHGKVMSGTIVVKTPEKK